MLLSPAVKHLENREKNQKTDANKAGERHEREKRFQAADSSVPNDIKELS